MGTKDIISKQAVKRIAIDLATYLLHLNVDPDSLELLETQSQRVEERRAGQRDWHGRVLHPAH